MNYNGGKDVIECLESVRNIDYPSYEIIVVDNASTDNSLESIRKKFERARIYTKGEIIKIIERNGFMAREIDYYYPPLDRISGKSVKALLRRVLAYLERNPLTKRLGMSIFVLAQKR